MRDVARPVRLFFRNPLLSLEADPGGNGYFEKMDAAAKDDDGNDHHWPGLEDVLVHEKREAQVEAE